MQSAAEQAWSAAVEAGSALTALKNLVDWPVTGVFYNPGDDELERELRLLANLESGTAEAALSFADHAEPVNDGQRVWADRLRRTRERRAELADAIASRRMGRAA